MSIWGKLAGLAGIGLAPFTGGTSLSWVPAAMGAGAAVDGALTGGGGDGNMDLNSVWGEDGAFLGDSTVTGGDGGSGNNGLIQMLLKYGLPALSGAMKGRTDQANLEKTLAQQKLLVQSGQALDQSKLDPFRGVMAQTSNAGKLERAMQPPPSYGPAAGSRYAGAVPPRAPINLSPAYLLGLQNAQSGVLSGKSTMPNMLEPTNWGKTGTQDLTMPLPGAPPAAAPGAVDGMGTVSPTSFLSRYGQTRVGKSRLDDEWDSYAA